VNTAAPLPRGARNWPDTAGVAKAADYQARAVDRIREILSTEHAVVRREVESRISEGHWQGSGENIDPHHVSNALRFLTEQRGELEWVSAPTRGKGKQPVPTLQPVNRYGRATKIEQAAARKRLLYGRYMGWASGTQRHPHGLVGPAGEAATRAGIMESEVVIPLTSDAGAVSNVLGVSVPGPLDSAGFMVPVSSQGLPGAPVTLLFEVKNLRQWMYPSAAEIYQLLGKAVVVQQAQPDVSVVPILACRRSHPTLFWMASQLGFVVIAMDRQFLGPHVAEPKYLEVRNELHFHDLTLGNGPSLRVRDRLKGAVRKNCIEFAQTWQRTVSDTQISAALLQLSRTTDRRTRAALAETVEKLAVDNGWGDGWPVG
jgi:hypothetical protein